MRPRRCVALLLLMVMLTGMSPAAHADNATPAPYTPQEFPGWALNLRRGEIIAIGVFPISLLASSILYDVVRYSYQRFDPDYAPWFFAPPGAPQLSDAERVGILFGAVGISLTIAVVDFMLGRRERRGGR